MPANTNPIFSLTPQVACVTITAANTATDGSGVISTLFTAGANGSRVKRITFINSQASAATSTAMRGVVFLSYDAGATWHPYAEIAIPAATRSVSAIGSRQTITPNAGLVLGAGDVVGVTITAYAGAQDRVTAILEGGDY